MFALGQRRDVWQDEVSAKESKRVGYPCLGKNFRIEGRRGCPLWGNSGHPGRRVYIDQCRRRNFAHNLSSVFERRLRVCRPRVSALFFRSGARATTSAFFAAAWLLWDKTWRVGCVGLLHGRLTVPGGEFTKLHESRDYDH